jgi:hypothetical protein
LLLLLVSTEVFFGGIIADDDSDGGGWDETPGTLFWTEKLLPEFLGTKVVDEVVGRFSRTMRRSKFEAGLC